MNKIVTIFILSILSISLTSCFKWWDEEKSAENKDNLTTNEQNVMNEKIIVSWSTVSLNYIGTLEDWTEFDNSYKRWEPLEFTAGAGQMIAWFDAWVIGMKTWEKKTLIIEAKDAYWEYDESKKQIVNRDDLSSFENAWYKLEIWEKLPTQFGMLTISEANEKEITLDLNHELAGKTLKFDIEIVDVK